MVQLAEDAASSKVRLDIQFNALSMEIFSFPPGYCIHYLFLPMFLCHGMLLNNQNSGFDKIGRGLNMVPKVFLF